MKGLTKRIESIFSNLKDGNDKFTINLEITLNGKKRRYNFSGQNFNIIIGRNNDCDVVIEHNSVSRTHARLWMEEGVIWAEDMGSKNGTYICGKKIAEKSMVKDEITVGEVRVKIDRLMNYEKGNNALIPDEKHFRLSLITGIILLITGFGIVIFAVFHSFL